jgi:two-component system chemotaxis response regulator CheY
MADIQKFKILVIDDNELTRAVLCAILHSEESYDVIGEATNGETGLELALKLRPDIVCLDVVMPRSDGLEVLTQIKEKLPSAMILMVTFNNDRTTGADGSTARRGWFYYQTIHPGTVLNTVQQAAAKSRALKASASAS